MDEDDGDDDDGDGADGAPAAGGDEHPAEPSEYGPNMEVEDVGSAEDDDAGSEAGKGDEIVALSGCHMGARAPSRKASAIALSDEEATASGAAEDRVHEFNANLVRLRRLQELKDQMESTRRELEKKMLD